MAGEDPKPRPIKRYFTQEDYENGLCDASGKAIPGKPSEPPRVSNANRVRGKRVSPEIAAKIAANPSAASRSGTLQPANQGVQPNAKEAVDPLKLDPKPAETGFHDTIPPADDTPPAADAPPSDPAQPAGNQADQA